MDADQPKRFTTLLTRNEFLSSNTKLFRLDFKPNEGFNFLAGQFAMIAIKDKTGRVPYYCRRPNIQRIKKV